MKMKAFVYSKVTNKKIAMIQDVTNVESLEGNKVVFFTSNDEKFTFDTREVKATTYQN